MKQKILILIIVLGNFHIDLHAQKIAIKTGHLILPSTEEILENRIIVVEHGKVIEVIKNLKGIAVDSIIDLSDSWITPGLMDCHVHLTSNMTYRNIDIYQRYVGESDTYRVLRGVKNANLLLNGGFTTVKEIGNDGNYVTADLIKAITNNWIVGPTIQYAGKIIAPYGGQTHGVSNQHEGFWEYEFLDADSHDEMRKAIRKNIYYGANTIKLVTGDQDYFYTKEDISFAVNEAKRAGVKVTVHAGGGDAAKNVILGGAAAIEHGFFLDENLLKLMKEKGTYLVGTDFSFNNWYAYGMDSTNASYMYNTTRDRLKLAYSIGVKMAFGTDIIVDIDGMNRLESNLEVLKTWKDAEIPPMHILKCMTINASELLGMNLNRGKIDVGYFADIIAFKKNPLDDIENIKSIHFVMKEGEIIRRD